MGEQFLRKQAHGFRHRHDAAFNRMKVPDLLTEVEPDLMRIEVACDDARVLQPAEEGEGVVLRRTADAVDVLRGNEKVGEVRAADRPRLANALSCGSGMLRALVVNHSLISQSFTVQLEERP